MASFFPQWPICDSQVFEWGLVLLLFHAPGWDAMMGRKSESITRNDAVGDRFHGGKITVEREHTHTHARTHEKGVK